MWPFHTKDKQQEQTPSAANETGPVVCDVCSGVMSSEKGYLLTTTQVATSEAYWEFSFRRHPQFFTAESKGEDLALYVRRIADSSTDWRICENCIALFDVDVEVTARNYIEGNSPPGAGPVERQAISMAAAYAWVKLYRHWPCSIQVGRSPITYDETAGPQCDFCSRIITNKEEV